MKKWTKFQARIPCNGARDADMLICEHEACKLWYFGWRVGLKKFLGFKWLEFTK